MAQVRAGEKENRTLANVNAKLRMHNLPGSGTLSLENHFPALSQSPLWNAVKA